MEYYDAIRIYRLIQDKQSCIEESFAKELLELLENEITEKYKKRGTIKSIVKKFLYEGENDKLVRLKKANKLTINSTDYYAYIDGFKMAWSTMDYGFGVNEPNNTYDWEPLINVIKNPIEIPITDELINGMYSAIFQDEVLNDEVLNNEKCGYIIRGPNGYEIKVNPIYLKTCIDFTEASKLIADANTNSKPIILYGKEDRNALLQPIRM